MLWTSIRVPVDVRDALNEYRQRLERQMQIQPGRLPDWLESQQGVTLSNVIEYLLCQQQRHSERSRLSKQRRTAASGLARLLAAGGSTNGSVSSEQALQASDSQPGEDIPVHSD